MNSIDFLLEDLNDEQRAAVTHEDGPLLIVAGAGTGKTTVITRRIAWLIMTGRCKSEEVLAMTFTNKAAAEMEERVDRVIPYGYVDLWISTFHAFCEKIVRRHALEIGLPIDFKLVNQTTAWMLVRKNLHRFDLNIYRPLGNPTKCIHEMIKHFSRCKDEEIPPHNYLDYAQKNNDQKTVELANAFQTYEQVLLENSALDFGGLVIAALRLFRERPEILERYQKQFRYILVDEFQDTNFAQYELIKLLSAPEHNITVVGDDDQCLPGTARISLSNNSTKFIARIKKGEEVLTGYGKGHIGVSCVNHVFKRKITTDFITVQTEQGTTVTVTANHKMFCHVPKISDKKWYYVYLMYRMDIGWRIGVTNDLSMRLRLERSADYIVGVRSYTSQEEARYCEVLWSLRYGIPTVCFKEREGVVIQGNRLRMLYKQLDVDARVARFAKDLGVSLAAYHECLSGVVRGSKKRIIIHIRMCYRKYPSKHALKKKSILHKAPISHIVFLETSDTIIIQKLQKRGFSLTRGRKECMRLRFASCDHEKVTATAEMLRKITGGLIECGFVAGKLHQKNLLSIVMPASNLLVGHYLPVQHEHTICYEKIISIHRKRRTQTVYDLEVDRTHNFIANGVVVHNSVYKFRGASLANILEFKKEYPHSKEVVLVQNYRSAQTILDTAYRLIQHNNPRRLECQLETLDKKLRAALPKEGSVAHIHCETVDEEVSFVVRIIQERIASDPQCSWGEFAILIRSNQFAKPFCSAFEQAGVPYQFISQKGLYAKPVILDAIAYLTVIDNVYGNPSLYRVLTFPFWNFSPLEVMELTHTAKKKGTSLWEAVCESTLPQAEVFRACVKKHAQHARTATPTEMFLLFLHDTGALEKLKNGETQEQRESLSYLNQFYRVIKDRQSEDPSLRLREFLLSLEYEREAGDEGSLASDIDLGPDTVKIMTVHASKGLEFSTVFVVHMADKKFPTIERDDALPLPLELVKETLPLEGDVHLEEERRLLYVAITRAKKDVLFLSSSDYGGVKMRKPSRFLVEAGCELPQKSLEMKEKMGEKTFSLRSPIAQNQVFVKESYPLPTRFSFTQISAFQKCPLQYKFAFLIKIPIFGKPQLSFGKSMHATLQCFVQEAISRTEGKEIVAWPSLDELCAMFDQCWLGEWYRSKKEQEEARQKGSTILAKFHKRIVQECASRPLMVEKDFTIKIPTASGPVTVKGRIDRVDTTDRGGIEIIDYKTGTPKLSTALRGDDKEQLVLYQIAVEEALGEKVEKLTYLYLEDTTSVSFLADEKEKKRLKEKIGGVINEIEKSSFSPTPGWHCRFCDFRDICEFRQV